MIYLTSNIKGVVYSKFRSAETEARVTVLVVDRYMMFLLS